MSIATDIIDKSKLVGVVMTKDGSVEPDLSTHFGLMHRMKRVEMMLADIMAYLDLQDVAVKAIDSTVKTLDTTVKALDTAVKELKPVEPIK